MTTREMGIGKQRVFRRPPPSDQEVRFVAPEPGALVREMVAAGIVPALEGTELLTAAHAARSRFQPLPAPTGQAPFRMALSSVLSDEDMQRIQNSGRLVFHAAGDTGGIGDRNDAPGARQVPVVTCMREDFSRPDPADRPAFFYLVGDAVYFRGERENYYPQFYDPYEFYPAPIFAIPGNHDGDFNPNAPSLEAFVRNFCSAAPAVSPDALDIVRDTMTQPNVYFTLQTPLATIIGLYSNVPEGGEIRADQQAWFTAEMQAAPQDRALVVAVHHPLFSADTNHSGSQAMQDSFRTAIASSQRYPDLVLTGHVHNYQRFTWELDGRQIPVLVTGNGGYPNLHKVARPNGNRLHTPFRAAGSDATLENYVDNRHGFTRIEITAGKITGKYYAVPFNHEERGERVDIFHLDLATHQLVTG